MERQIKGGYILISLGLIALSAGASLTVDYERITKTKKHIVLTGIKVADTVMPDLCVKPIFGNGTITFSDVYGYDIVISSNGSASVSEHTQPSGGGGTQLYKHTVTLSGEGPSSVVFINNQSAQYTSMTEITSDLEAHPILVSSNGADFTGAQAGAGVIVSVALMTLVSDTVTEY